LWKSRQRLQRACKSASDLVLTRSSDDHLHQLKNRLFVFHDNGFEHRHSPISSWLLPRHGLLLQWNIDIDPRAAARLGMNGQGRAFYGGKPSSNVINPDSAISPFSYGQLI